MDAETLFAYDANAVSYAAEWLAQQAPDHMYALLRTYFTTGSTADVGCGAGRDTAWMASSGFDARGFDASAGLLAQACVAHPALRFDYAVLPELAGVERAAFQNVLCETVIMHLEPVEVGPSVRSLLALLRPGGTLYLSWRVTDDAAKRDPAGRLYAAFDKATCWRGSRPTTRSCTTRSASAPRRASASAPRRASACSAWSSGAQPDAHAATRRSASSLKR
jgi:SAM-dependent methyltransferase